MAGREAAAVADDLECLGIAPFGEPGPVPGSCGDQVGLKVGPHRRLGPEDIDGPYLRVEVRVDADEAARPEIHGRRWRLEAVDPADLPRSDYRGAVSVAVILVHVVDRVRVDHGRLHLANHPADDPYGRVALADPGVLQVLEVEPCAEDPGCQLGFACPGVLRAAAGTAAHRQDRDVMPHLAVGGQGSAGADLDVIRMGADGQHNLAPGQPGSAALGDELGDHRGQPGRPQRFLLEVVGAVAQRADGDVHGGMCRDDRDGEEGIRPPQRLKQLDTGHARHLHVRQDQIPRLGTREPQRDGRVGGVHHLEAVPHGQHLDSETGSLEIVLDEEYPPPRRCRVDGRHAWQSAP